MIRRIPRKSKNSRNRVKRFETGRSNSCSSNVRNTRSRRYETQHVNNRRLRRRFESFNGQDTFEQTYAELQAFAKELVKEYGEEVTDEMNVVFWAKDQQGTPCLVKGAYNYWSGDDEMTMTEIANGDKPSGFLSALDKCFKEAVPWIAEYCAEKVIEFAAEEYNLDLNRGDVMKQCFEGGLDYEAFYAYIVENFGDIDDDEYEFVSNCQERWESDYFDEVYSFGWEYSTVKQGNLFYGRSNSDTARGCTFLVSVSMFGETDDCSYAGNTVIDEKGLHKLADAIAQGKTERPRW